MGDPHVSESQTSPASGAKTKASWFQLVFLVAISGLIAFAYNHWNPNGIRALEPGDSTALNASSAIPAEAGTQLGVESRLVPSEFVHHGKISDDGFPIVSWEEVEKLIKNHIALPVDARPEWSFEAGHLPGAVCLPFSFPTTQAYRDFSKLHSKTRPLIIYCGEPSCERSKYLAKKLRDEFEYSSLWLYEGGYEDYLTRTR
jgi:rhodanese-related sulfurtransferase